MFRFNFFSWDSYILGGLQEEPKIQEKIVLGKYYDSKITYLREAVEKG